MQSEEELLGIVRSLIRTRGPNSEIKFHQYADGRLRRARKAVTRGGRVTRSYYPVAASAGSLPCESPNERVAYMMLAFMSRIAIAVAQPFELVIDEGDSTISRFPDLFVRTTDGINWAIEVLLANRLEKPDERADLSRKAHHLHEHGMQLAVWTDEMIGPDLLRRNLSRLTRFRHFQHDPEIEQRVLEILRRKSPLSIRDIALEEIRSDLSSLYALIAKGRISADLSSAPCTALSLWPNKHAGRLFDEDNFFRPWR